MLPARHRLTEPADFAATIRGAGTRRSGSRHLVVHVRLAPPASADSSPPARVGLVVSKAVGNSVVRHRVARRLRHQVAPLLAEVAPGTDLVIRASPAAAGASSTELAQSLQRCLRDALQGPQ